MSNETTTGPYTVGPNDGFGNYPIIGTPTMVGTYKHEQLAQNACERFNAIYLAGQASREQWISAEERLPEERMYPDDETGRSKPDGRSQEVLMGYLPPNGRQFHVLDLGHYSQKEGAWISKKGMLCTHWMYLPSPPNKQP